HTIAIVGAKGGVGVTSLAVNMASALVQLEYAVTVAEMRAGHGEMRLHLKLPVEPNLGKLLDLEPKAVGRTEVERFVQYHESGLRVLVAPTVVAEQSLDGEHVSAIVEALKVGTDFLILDVPPMLDRAVRKALEAS